MRKVLPLPFLLFCLSCNGDDTNDGVDSSFACDCPTPAAADVDYDNVGSGLSGTDVQDAVDELAARPEPPGDSYDRIMFVEDMLVIDTPSASSRTVTCPGTPPNLGRALGGACEGGDIDTTLQGTALFENGYRCVWRYAGTGSVTLTAKVTCLMPAETQ